LHQDVEKGVKLMTEQTLIDKSAALDAMKAMAEKIGVKGVAALLVVPVQEDEWEELTLSVQICGRFQRPADPERDKDGQKDKGTNYLAVVSSKIAESLRTKRNSGQPADADKPTGELGYGGCLIFQDGNQYILLAFSGGTVEEDIQIAQAGAEALGF
jgi:hypothetical protein